MNSRYDNAWSRLTAAARRAPLAEADEIAPLGFATRIVAGADVRPAAGLFAGIAFERLAARALGFACAGALAVTLWASVPTSVEARSSDITASTDSYLDPVGAIIEVVQS